MTRSALIAIDPGVTGAIAVQTYRDGVRLYAMPDTLVLLYGLFQDDFDNFDVRYGDNSPIALLENVGFHRPGNSAVASCTFARHCGALEMALVASRIPYTKVTPGKWMKTLYGDALPREKTERKEYIYQQTKLAHPELPKLFKYQADALGMLDYMIREEKKNEVQS
jgi:hypothetical protein